MFEVKALVMVFAPSLLTKRMGVPPSRRRISVGWIGERPSCGSERMGRGSGRHGLRLPRFFVANDGIENGQELSGDSNHGDHLGFPLGDETFVKGF